MDPDACNDLSMFDYDVTMRKRERRAFDTLRPSGQAGFFVFERETTYTTFIHFLIAMAYPDSENFA